MNPGIIFTAILALCSYASSFPKETESAFSFVKNNSTDISMLREYMSCYEARIAISIVAPEISQYNNLYDAVQVYALMVLYVQGDASNFSVGPFQMKPTFAEDIEQIVNNNDNLRHKYGKLIIRGNSAKKIRHERVCRLSSLKWQIIYLAAFMDVIKSKISLWGIVNTDQRVRYIATIYNAGLNKSKKDVEKMMTLKQFPRLSSHAFNYSEVSLEFFKNSNFCDYFTISK